MPDAPMAWAWVTTIPEAMYHDEPRLRAHLDHAAQDAARAAAREGLTLKGDLVVQALALVYIEDSSEEFGQLVSPDWARAAGWDPDTLPKHVALRMEWSL